MTTTEVSTASEQPRRAFSPSLVIAAVVGVVGSAMVMLGSYAVGWLAAASPLNQWQVLTPLRATNHGVAIGTLLLTLGCWVMFWAWLRLGIVLRRRVSSQQGFYRFPAGSLAPVTIITTLWILPQLLCLPIFSRDIFAYVNQGRLVLSGGDPYEEGISNLSNWFQLGTDTTWAEDATPYGPIFLWIAAGIMAVSGVDSPDLAILLFRVVAVAGVALIMYYVPTLAAHYGVDPARAQWISAANPLFIISFVSSAHNDALMVGFAVAGIYYAVRGRGLIAVLLVVASIGIKPITVVLLPFIGLWWAGRNPGWVRKFGYWALTLAIALAVLVAVGLINGYGFGWVSVMAETGTGSVPWSPIGFTYDMIRTPLNALGIPSDWVLDVLKLIGRIASVIIVLILMFTGRQSQLLQRTTWAFATIVLLSPIIQPWYVLWLLPLFVVVGIKGNWQLKLVIVIVAFFLAFGAADQLFIWQFLTVGEFMPHLSTAVSWICIIWILLLDPLTSRMMKEDWHVRDGLKNTWRRLRTLRASDLAFWRITRTPDRPPISREPDRSGADQ
ncbi:polyprenol phosphomannose-dependent alpha 1,6 mannosyltransferase MptB [Auritidibacter ignavus]|uniref:polyprenol phosphomannose-dependent alpha 1,6 mannosyltransferase MptB n=1 Tax=Auritidibacter ignavus TaxID=678932 RepID=UPI0024493119|nr:polyprenol phosphomannose-dependent alpha 1,6 mannosyltransferase MptB [Auritidibacter ignavus]WGH84174.1 polyprenol phosphomannose-dependent alpha 1,6 mannosyltransferase MptB [Auritidibacter ignavus]